MQNNKVVIIIPYFGKYPVWFDLYLYSCSRQSGVDFLFYSDCDNTVYPSYPNVRFCNVSYEEYCRYVSNFLGVNFFPANPYKLCDIRPFLGLIHDNDIKAYEWWGYADVDVIYGDLSLVINTKTLKRYDVITTHADRLAGHFTIIRKESLFTSIGYTIDDWQRKLESEHGLGVDEHDFTKVVRPGITTLFRIYRCIARLWKLDLYKFLWLPNIIKSVFSRIYIREYNTSDIPKDGEKWVYDFDKGIITNPKGKSLPYLHFLFFKKTPFAIQKNYWQGDYWNVNPNLKCGKIIFSNIGVEHEQ